MSGLIVRSARFECVKCRECPVLVSGVSRLSVGFDCPERVRFECLGLCVQGVRFGCAQCPVCPKCLVGVGGVSNLSVRIIHNVRSSRVSGFSVRF